MTSKANDAQQGKSEPDTPRILITGATGFVGKHLCAELASRGVPAHKLYAASRKPGTAPIPGTQTVAFDIGDQDAIIHAIKTINPTAVIHLAAISVSQEATNDATTTWRVNFDAARMFGQAILDHAPTARLVFASSAETYGMSLREVTGPIEETVCAKPLTVYGAAKASAEIALMQMASQGLDVVCFRAFNHTGPGQTTNFAVPAFAKKIIEVEKGMREGKITVGDLDVKRDFLDARDVARAYADALDKPSYDYEERIMNVASGVSYKMGDILKAMAGQTTKQIDIFVDQTMLRPGQIPDIRGANDKIKRVLGWVPRIQFEQTLNDVLSYYRDILK